MKILVAVDSFKGSLTSAEVAEAVTAGITESGVSAQVVTVPIADGGEGTCATLLAGLGGEYIGLQVHGPLREEIPVTYGILPDGTAVIEMAAAAGLPLVPMDQRNPLHTSTVGVGEMIKDALTHGCRKFIIGLGGSATNDGGIGMLTALGYRFLDTNNRPIEPVGASLSAICSVDCSHVLSGLEACHFLAACDVENPFYGECGAAYVFAPQKGASPSCVQLLDQGLQNFAQVIHNYCGISVADMRGAGAAGGLGGGLYAFLNAELKPGTEIIFEHLHLEDLVQQADVVFTGEGKVDCQSIMGKAPSAIAKLGRKYGKPVILIAGSISDDALAAHEAGVTAMFSITDGPMSLDAAMDNTHARHLVAKTVRQIMQLVQYPFH